MAFNARAYGIDRVSETLQEISPKNGPNGHFAAPEEGTSPKLQQKNGMGVENGVSNKNIPLSTHFGPSL